MNEFETNGVALDEALGPGWSFSGSYAPTDAIFLLRTAQVKEVGLEEKERLIRNGGAHYSSMISPEKAPSAKAVAIYEAAMERNGDKLAAACLSLAKGMAEELGTRIILASLARAGTPIGVIVGRILRSRFGVRAEHYSISAVRDKGVDASALEWIRRYADPKGKVAFVDGWTGKGVISRELKASVAEFNSRTGANFPDGLWTIADLAGSAYRSASREDWLIPSALMNSTISGLVSRTVVSDDLVGPGQFHACKMFEEFAEQDFSVRFVDEIFERSKALALPSDGLFGESPELAQTSRSLVDAVMKSAGVSDANFVKPGIGESSRVMLRRKPDQLWLRDRADPDCAHLLMLAEELGTPLLESPTLPYKAAAVIRSKD